MEINKNLNEEEITKNILSIAEIENTKISTSKNVELNNSLFQIYESILEPLKGIEQRDRELQLAVLRLQCAEKAQSKFSKGLLIFSILTCFLFVVVLFACISVFIEHLGTKPWIVNFLEMFLSLIIFSIFLVVPPLIGHFMNNNKKKQLEKESNKIDELHKSNIEKAKKISLDNSYVLALIPKEYRHYKAVLYFVKSYQASRVDCVREAIVCYEEDACKNNIVSTSSELNSILCNIDTNYNF